MVRLLLKIRCWLQILSHINTRELNGMNKLMKEYHWAFAHKKFLLWLIKKTINKLTQIDRFLLKLSVKVNQMIINRLDKLNGNNTSCN